MIWVLLLGLVSHLAAADTYVKAYTIGNSHPWFGLNYLDLQSKCSGQVDFNIFDPMRFRDWAANNCKYGSYNERWCKDLPSDMIDEVRLSAWMKKKCTLQPPNFVQVLHLLSGSQKWTKQKVAYTVGSASGSGTPIFAILPKKFRKLRFEYLIVPFGHFPSKQSVKVLEVKKNQIDPQLFPKGTSLKIVTKKETGTFQNSGKDYQTSYIASARLILEQNGAQSVLLASKWRRMTDSPGNASVNVHTILNDLNGDALPEIIANTPDGWFLLVSSSSKNKTYEKIELLRYDPRPT